MFSTFGVLFGCYVKLIEQRQVCQQAITVGPAHATHFLGGGSYKLSSAELLMAYSVLWRHQQTYIQMSRQLQLQ